MRTNGRILWIAAAALAVGSLGPAVAENEAYVPGLNGVTAPEVLSETWVDPVVPEGLTLSKPVALDVEFVVGTDGVARDIRVRGGKSNPALVRSTIDALSQWRFEPGRWNGKPVDTLPRIQVRFGGNRPDPTVAQVSAPAPPAAGDPFMNTMIVRDAGRAVPGLRLRGKDRPPNQSPPCFGAVAQEFQSAGPRKIYVRPDPPTRVVSMTQATPQPAPKN